MMSTKCLIPGFGWCNLFHGLEGCAMGQILHGSATTTEAVRRAIQHSQREPEGSGEQVRYGVNPKTILKWRKRSSVAEFSPTGPREPKSFGSGRSKMRRSSSRSGAHTLLPLDDCLYALQATIPHLTRSSLHRCLQRHGISRLPEVEGDKAAKKKFKSYAIGFSFTSTSPKSGDQRRRKLHLFVGIDRTSKLAFVQLHEQADRRRRLSLSSKALIAATPYRLHTIFTRQRDPLCRLCLATATAGRRAIGAPRFDQRLPPSTASNIG